MRADQVRDGDVVSNVLGETLYVRETSTDGGRVLLRLSASQDGLGAWFAYDSADELSPAQA